MEVRNAGIENKATKKASVYKYNLISTRIVRIVPVRGNEDRTSKGTDLHSCVAASGSSSFRDPLELAGADAMPL